MMITKFLAWIGFLTGLAVLALQFALTIPARMEAGDNFPLALVFYFSFFTILSNIVIMLIHLATIWQTPVLAWFDQQTTRTMMAAIISLVMIAYHFLLAPVWDPQGLFKLADIGLHYVTPIIYLAMWLNWPRAQLLPWSSALIMLLPPAIYLAYAMTRGALTGEYPYFFIDAGRLGYGLVALNAFALLVVLLVLNLIALAIDRSRSR